MYGIAWSAMLCWMSVGHYDTHPGNQLAESFNSSIFVK